MISESQTTCLLQLHLQPGPPACCTCRPARWRACMPSPACKSGSRLVSPGSFFRDRCFHCWMCRLKSAVAAKGIGLMVGDACITSSCMPSSAAWQRGRVPRHMLHASCEVGHWARTSAAALCPGPAAGDKWELSNKMQVGCCLCAMVHALDGLAAFVFCY